MCAYACLFACACAFVHVMSGVCVLRLFVCLYVRVFVCVCVCVRACEFVNMCGECVCVFLCAARALRSRARELSARLTRAAAAER